MDSKNSFAKLLIEAFQQLNEEQKQEQKSKKQSNLRHKKSMNNENNKKRQLNETANNYHKLKSHQNTSIKNSTSINDNNNNESEISDSESSSDASENEYELDATLTLQDFVVTLLKFAPKHKILISQLTLKITDTFDKSIKQLSGLKSREFFNAMKQKNIIKIKTEKTENGALSFAQLINIKKNKKHKHISIKNEFENNNVSMKVINELNSKNDTIKHQKIKNKVRNPWQWNENENENKNESQTENENENENENEAETECVPMEINTNNNNNNNSNNLETKHEIKHVQELQYEDVSEIIRSAILRNFLDGSRDKIMLSSVPAYCYKYTRIKWKKIMIQTPKEFINDMVFNGLVVLQTEWKHNVAYPFIILDKQSEKVKQLDIETLNEIIDWEQKGNNKSNGNNYKEKVKQLILSKLHSNKKLFVSTIGGIVLNHFEKAWDVMMDCSIHEFIGDMVKDKLIEMEGGGLGNDKYIIGCKNRKRKLEMNDNMNNNNNNNSNNNEEEIKEPKRKKQRKNENKRVNKKCNDKIVLSAIKLNEQNGMEMAQNMIQTFKQLDSKHDIHFHFELDE